MAPLFDGAVFYTLKEWWSPIHYQDSEILIKTKGGEWRFVKSLPRQPLSDKEHVLIPDPDQASHARLVRSLIKGVHEDVTVDHVPRMVSTTWVRNCVTTESILLRDYGDSTASRTYGVPAECHMQYLELRDALRRNDWQKVNIPTFFLEWCKVHPEYDPDWTRKLKAVLEHDCPLFAEAGKLNRSIPGPAQSGPSRLSTGVAPGPVDSAIRQAATASFDTRPRLQRPSSISRGRNREAEQRYAQKIGSAITNTVSSNGDATSEQSRKLRDNAYEISTGSRSQVARLHPIIKKPPDVARSTDSANVGRDVDDMQVKKKDWILFTSIGRRVLQPWVDWSKFIGDEADHTQSALERSEMVPLLQMVLSEHALVFDAQDWDLYHNKNSSRTLGPWNHCHIANMKRADLSTQDFCIPILQDAVWSLTLVKHSSRSQITLVNCNDNLGVFKRDFEAMMTDYRHSAVLKGRPDMSESDGWREVRNWAYSNPCDIRTKTIPEFVPTAFSGHVVLAAACLWVGPAALGKSFSAPSSDPKVIAGRKFLGRIQQRFGL